MTGVYVIYRNRMFGDAIQAVLRRHPGIRLLGATDDPERAEAGIACLTPDVILVEEAAGQSSVHVQSILTNPVPCRLVMLCPDRDGMHVWSQQWRASVGPDDLVDAVVSVHNGQHEDVTQPRVE